MSEVHWGLAGSVGAQGPAGVEVASGGIGVPKCVRVSGSIRGLLGYWGPSGE